MLVADVLGCFDTAMVNPMMTILETDHDREKVGRNSPTSSGHAGRSGQNRSRSP